MAIEFTEAALIYSGSQISETHKVPVGEKYIIRIGLHVTEDVILFIPLGFDSLITNDEKIFCCKEDYTKEDYHSKFTGSEFDELLQRVVQLDAEPVQPIGGNENE